MKLYLLCPSAPEGYSLCAKEFCKYARAVSGCEPIPAEPENIPEGDGYILLRCADQPLIPGLSGSEEGAPAPGSDDFRIRSMTLRGKPALVLTGGRIRSVFYAVYRYFEVFCGCRWFYDGDRIPHRDCLVLEGISLTESTRMTYRGMRAFAHRSLNRFQAEHWSYGQWVAHMDWMLKKRLNLFMPRIGLDDLFQKAFPDLVSYPDPEKPLPEAGDGYDDRSLFWDLAYRGELRKKVLSYARAHELMVPEDVGPMTHWYARTPVEYLEKAKPSLLAQYDCSRYSEQTGLVWDIREEKNFEAYFELTRAHIRAYGARGLFHIIGLAERNFFPNREDNLRLKLYVYRRVARWLSENYPGDPLLIASWDLWMYYTPEEVRKLLSVLDPESHILFDYTSDCLKTGHNYLSWGVQNTYPYVFGIFQGYEPDNDIRGDYVTLQKRIEALSADNACRGLIFWPELSHGDPFMQEYFARHAWAPGKASLGQILSDYCKDRYGDRSEGMEIVWKKMLLLSPLCTWSDDSDADGCLFAKALLRPSRIFAADQSKNREIIRRTEALKPQALLLFRELSELCRGDDEMLRRDCLDLARSALSRFINGEILSMAVAYDRAIRTDRDASRLEAHGRAALKLLSLMEALLGTSDEFSLYVTLEGMKKVRPVKNPAAHCTLKRNADNIYCRSFVYECVSALYIPELSMLLSLLKFSLPTEAPGRPGKLEEVLEKAKAAQRAFESAPLPPFEKKGDLSHICKEITCVLENTPKEVLSC